MSIGSLKAVLKERHLEFVSAFMVGAVALFGLLLGPGGYLEGDKALLKSNVEMRRMWPALVHPDSLLVLQQLLRAAGVALLTLRNSCASQEGGFAPGLLQMALGSAMRLVLWGSMHDYEPEGPLGGSFCVCCIAVTFHIQLCAAFKAISAGIEASHERKKFLCLKLGGQLVFAFVAAVTNHFTVGSCSIADIIFTAIVACDVSAAPLFSVVACLTATDNIVSICPSLIFMCASEFLGLTWFLDFIGVGLTSDASNDEFKRALLVVKANMLKSVYGNPIMLMFIAYAVQFLLVVVSCILAIGLQRGSFETFFNSALPKGASEEVIESLKVVPYSEGMFGDEASECCAVCLAEFEIGDSLRVLPCQHQQFHASCVDHWLRRAGRCPLCVASIDPSESTKVS
jgi:hypothetical protein